MKKFFSYFMISMCLLGTSVVTSCSSDDDDKEDSLPELKYQSDAAIYNLEGNMEGIANIELTTAGNYFIEYEAGAPESSISKQRFECSTFTKNSDGSYQLDGKNTTLKIESAGEKNKYTITLGEKAYTAWKVGDIALFTKENQMDKICRSWKVKNAYLYISSSVIKPIEINVSNYKDLMKKIDENGYIVPYFTEIDYISFSNTNKYQDRLLYVVKTDSSVKRSVWQWKNNSKIILDESGEEIDVTFEGSTMKFNHKTVDGSTTIEWGYEFYATPMKLK